MDIKQNKLINRLISAILTKNYVKIVLVGIAILLSVIATADGNISGRVVSVADGDTLTVLDADRKSTRLNSSH